MPFMDFIPANAWDFPTVLNSMSPVFNKASQEGFKMETNLTIFSARAKQGIAQLKIRSAIQFARQ